MADDLSVTPHADRFRAVRAGLVGIAIGALAIAVAVIIAHANDSAAANSTRIAAGPRWSSWRPATTGNQGAAAIADYVAPFYRLTPAEQLVIITPISTKQLNASTGTFTGTGLTVALNSATPGSVSQLRPLAGQTVGYDLCGQGTANCAVPGTPSTTRELLLRREALELALYTFKYLPASTNVVVVLPPGRTTAKKARPVTVAVLFVRAELAPMLNEPINDTLAAYPPPVAALAAWKRTEEAALVETITARNLFSEQVEAQQDGSNLLVLNPLPAQ